MAVLIVFPAWFHPGLFGSDSDLLRAFAGCHYFVFPSVATAVRFAGLQSCFYKIAVSSYV